MRNKILFPTIIFICFLFLFGFIFNGQNGFKTPELFFDKEARASNLTASGFIEAEQVSISAEFGGKLKELKLEEGEKVRSGDVLAILDDTILEKQIAQAEMAVEVARANLTLVKASAREEEVRQKKAALEQAEALRDGAEKSWLNAIALKANPQDLNARVIASRGQFEIAERHVETSKKAWENASRDYDTSLKQAQAQLKAAEHQLQQARVNLEQAGRLKNALQPPIVSEDWIRPPYGIQNTLQYDLNVWQAQVAQEAIFIAESNRELAQSRLDGLLAARTWVDMAKGQYDMALATREAAKATLEDLVSTQKNPLSIKAQIDAAEAQYNQAVAALNLAKANLETTLAGSRPEQIRVAEAQVRQSEAALNLLQTQKEKMTLTSPVSGVIAQKAARAGEIILPGVSLLKIVNLETVTLKVYIPEVYIGQLRLNSLAQISVDSYPERKFQGRVTYISPQAEFTPKNIQTKEERTKTVFAVKIMVSNPEGILKPGMPADAVIELN